MNETFLSQIAAYLSHTYYKELDNICLIMPSNRGIVHLKKYLSNEIGKTFFPPDFFSIEQFMQKVSGLNLCTKEDVWIRLYHIYMANTNDNPKDTFHDFAAKANVILRDFSDIDLALADPTLVFSDLAAIKTLNFFGKSENELSDFQRNYLAFFKQLYVYYEKLKNDLLKEGKAYQGLMYRQASENIAPFCQQRSYQKYVFIGFNAMQASEWRILRFLKQENKLDIIVDADTFYFYDTQHEAGKFLRGMKEELLLDSMHFIGNYVDEIPKDIQIMGFPNKSLQAKHLPYILKEISQDPHKKTAIVLADESLLLPVLHAMDTSHCNITMGYPISHTSLYKLLYQYIQAIENKTNLNKQSKQESIYHKDIYVFISHPYMQALIVREGGNVNQLRNAILNKGKLFYTQAEIQELCKHLPQNMGDFLLKVFFSALHPGSFHEQLLYILSYIENVIVEHTEKEVYKMICHHIEVLSDLYKQIENPSLKSLRYLFESYISSLTLSFKSNPLSNIQIMGMLETRTLDFDNVIILSVNEGILPSGKNYQSFLPFDLKLHYNISTYQQADAVFSYHYYRLLQRAKHIYLLYDLDNKEGKLEKSRFVKQLQNEWRSKKHIQIHETIYGYPNPVPSDSDPIRITKNQSIIDQIKHINFSPTAINKFLVCELRFYLSEVLRIEQLAEVKEEIQANVIGIVIHKVLECFFKNHIPSEKLLNEDFIKEAVLQSFCDTSLTHMELTPQDVLSEKNYLVYHITVKYVHDYLTLYLTQKQNLKDWEVVDFEKKLYKSLQLSQGDPSTEMKLKGIVDRLDINQGIHTVVDYKTGKVENKELIIQNLEDLFNGDNDKAFQLMFYAYLYYLETHVTPLQARIISFRNLRDSLILHINANNLLTHEVFTQFESLLRQHLSRILDTNAPFSQTIVEEHCKWCDYKSLCMRE
jgi:ATP-dependent helicase/nuclease subunit B